MLFLTLYPPESMAKQPGQIKSTVGLAMTYGFHPNPPANFSWGSWAMPNRGGRIRTLRENRYQDAITESEWVGGGTFMEKI
jgi:hypothetical protein